VLSTGSQRKNRVEKHACFLKSERAHGSGPGAVGGAKGCGEATGRNGVVPAGAASGASTLGTAAGTALASGPAYVASRYADLGTVGSPSVEALAA